jgi:hypothetical protein
MRSFTARDVVRICEWGRDKHELDRALVLLRAASGAGTEAHDALARLPIGRRDALLIDLRMRTFGPSFELQSRCPVCGEGVEFAVGAREVAVEPPGDGAGGTLIVGVHEVEYRLPNSFDLAAIVGVAETRAARRALFVRCVVRARAGDSEVEAASLPEEVVAALAVRLAEEDPQADVTFKLECDRCRHEWRAVFDVLGCFWTELEAQARQIAREVHRIAAVYGWTESYILSMSAARRALYVELASEA